MVVLFFSFISFNERDKFVLEIFVSRPISGSSKIKSFGLFAKCS
ncbi:MAG: hypothetical protein U5K55_04875 [Aliarcobacter sp.]|nr:hypothetical protein [Aliarcobacter sp.]